MYSTPSRSPRKVLPNPSTTVNLSSNTLRKINHSETFHEIKLFLDWCTSSPLSSSSFIDLAKSIYIVSLIESLKTYFSCETPSLFSKTSTYHNLLTLQEQEIFTELFSITATLKIPKEQRIKQLKQIPLLNKHLTSKTENSISKYNLSTLKIFLKSNDLFFISFLITNYITLNISSLNSNPKSYPQNPSINFQNTNNKEPNTLFSEALNNLLISRKNIPLIKLKKIPKQFNPNTNFNTNNSIMSAQAILKLNLTSSTVLNDSQPLFTTINKKFTKIILSSVSDSSPTLKLLSLSSSKNKENLNTPNLTKRKISEDFYSSTLYNYPVKDTSIIKFKKPINNAVFMDPYPLILSTDISGSIYITEIFNSSAHLSTYHNNFKPIWDVSVHKSNSVFITASEDYTSKLYDIQKTNCIRIFNHFTSVSNCCLADNLDVAITVDGNNCLHVWNVNEAKKLFEVKLNKFLEFKEKVIKIKIDESLKGLFVCTSKGNLISLDLKNLDKIVSARKLDKKFYNENNNRNNFEGNFCCASFLENEIFGIKNAKRKIGEAKELKDKKEIWDNKMNEVNKYNVVIGGKNGGLRIWNYRNVFYECDVEKEKDNKVGKDENDEYVSCFKVFDDKVGESVSNVVYGVEGILCVI